MEHANISDNVIAYRKIKSSPDSRSGKSNIEFAKDAFDQIKSMGNCVAVALDIKGYFEHIDHIKLKREWKSIIKENSLPKDHYKVFKAITKYAYVGREELYRALGIIGHSSEKGRDAYLISYAELSREYKKLASNQTIRSLFDSGDLKVLKNTNNYGIPQGSPISDVLANLYLFEFDFYCELYARKFGGFYRRYSDDILFIIPANGQPVSDVIQFVKATLADVDEKLIISDKKPNAVHYTQLCERQNARNEFNSEDNSGLNYLGFRYDGQSIYLRNSTVSNLRRKISLALKSEIHQNIKRYEALDKERIRLRFNASDFKRRFDRVEGFEAKILRSDWTFHTYVRRSIDVFGHSDTSILQQVSKLEAFIARRYEAYFEKIWSKRYD